MKRRALLFFSLGLGPALVVGWVAFPRLLFARAEQPLRFSHATHASDKTGLGCADCHPIGEDGRFAGIPKVDNCAMCHSEPQGATDAEKRLVEEYVKPGREVPWLVYSRQPENVRFPHAVHVQARRRSPASAATARTGRARRSRPTRRTASPATAVTSGR